MAAMASTARFRRWCCSQQGFSPGVEGEVAAAFGGGRS
jgi:hypothetical protein